VGSLSNAAVHIVETPFDTWRLAFFTPAELAQASLSGPDADPDVDGATNWHEFLAGTDPRNPLSVLRVAIDAHTGAAILKFVAGSNHGYTLQYRDNLTAGAWLDLTNLSAAATNRIIIYPDSAGSAARYYRVSAP
jgi:hypothetical protein